MGRGGPCSFSLLDPDTLLEIEGGVVQVEPLSLYVGLVFVFDTKGVFMAGTDFNVKTEKN